MTPPSPPTAAPVSGRPGRLDYRATSLRPAWDSLPAHLQAAVGAAVGSVVVEGAAPVTTGFTGAYAGRVRLADGREVFTKVGTPAQPHVVGALTEEARLLAALPSGIPAPALVAAGGSGGWRFLVLELLEGHLPGMPWTRPDADAAHEACLALAEAGTPAPADLVSGSFGPAFAGADQVQATAAALAGGSFVPAPGLSGGLLEHAAEVARLTRLAPGVLQGASLVHSDLRPDNLLVDRSGRAHVLDWNWLCTGPGWVDLVGLMPLMALDGLDTDAVMAGSPLTRDADPEHVDAFLAAVTVYMSGNLAAPPPPGCTPALRHHQHHMAGAFLAMLADRRGWAV
jgi:Phosphotransferase enzyme family